MKNGYAICLNEWIYDNKIKTELRLLLTISNLTAKNGYCYANNIYLANKLNTTTVTISKQIKNLEKFGYLSIKYKRKGVVITGREIRLKTEQSTIKESFNGTVKENFNTTVKENFKDNNTSNNNNTTTKEPEEVVDYSLEVNKIIDSYIDKIKSDENSSWRELFYMKNKLRKGSLSKLLNVFVVDYKLREHGKPKSLKDFKLHFTNWVNSQEKFNKLDDHKIQSSKSLGV